MIVHLLCLTLAIAINKSASQTMTAMPTTCISTGTLVTLRCDANDTANTILFYLNGINKGGCFSGVCNTGIAGYVQPTQSGTFTDMIITAYDSSRDGGSWTCSYGSSTSDPYTLELKNCNSEESSSVDTLTIVGGVFGGVVGVGAASGLVVGGSILLKKQASDKNDRTVVPREDDVEGGNAAAYSSADKPVTNGRTVVPGADDEKGGGTAAAESSTVKPDKDTSNVEQKDNHTDDKKHKDTNAYKDTKREEPKDSSYNFGVGERDLPPNPQIRQIQQGRLEPITPKKGKKTEKKIDGEENTNN